MNTFTVTVMAVLALNALPFAEAAPKAASCSSFKKLQFKKVKRDIKTPSGSTIKDFDVFVATTEGYEIQVGEVPKMIRNLKTGRSCEVLVGAAFGKGDVYELPGSDLLLFSSFTGGQHMFTLVKMKDCSKEFEKIFYAKGKIQHDRLIVPTSCGDCEQKGELAKDCKCESQEIWKLTPDCTLKEPE